MSIHLHRPTRPFRMTMSHVFQNPLTMKQSCTYVEPWEYRSPIQSTCGLFLIHGNSLTQNRSGWQYGEAPKRGLLFPRYSRQLRHAIHARRDLRTSHGRSVIYSSTVIFTLLPCRFSVPFDITFPSRRSSCKNRAQMTTPGRGITGC